MLADTYGNMKKSVEGKRTARSQDWVRGWWEHLGPEPIFIEDKHHLKRVCLDIKKRTGKNLIPKAFAKCSSSGKGLEWNF